MVAYRAREAFSRADEMITIVEKIKGDDRTASGYTVTVVREIRIGRIEAIGYAGFYSI